MIGKKKKVTIPILEKGEIEKIDADSENLENEMRVIEGKIEEITGEEGRRLKEKLDEAKLELMRARDIIETAQDSISDLSNEENVRGEEIKDIARKEGRLSKEIDSVGDKKKKVEEK